MIKLNVLIILFLVGFQLFAQESLFDEGKRIDEIIKGERTNCSTIEEGMTPTLLFETLSPKVNVNSSSTAITLQMKIIYYRCIRKEGSNSPQFTITDPSVPYKYSIEQLDGSTNTIQVKSQSHRFNVKLKHSKVEPGYPKKIGSSGNVHLIQVTIPLKELLTPSQQIKLRNGTTIDVSIPVISEVSTDYAIDSQTSDNTGYSQGSTFSWNISLSMSGKGPLKALIKNIN